MILVVNRGLSNFLQVGNALIAIKTENLFRETHGDFDSFCRDTFGLGRSTCDQLVRSTQTAQLLIDNDLPPPASAAIARQLVSLPTPELKVATWQAVQAASPKSGPTKCITAAVARTVKVAITSSSPNGKTRHYAPAELGFLRPIRRLAKINGFAANLVIAHIEDFAKAQRAFEACDTLIARCQEVRTALAQRFPELAK